MAGRSNPSSFQIANAFLDPKQMRFCVYPPRVESISFNPLGLPEVCPTGLPKPNILGACVPAAGSLGVGELDVGLRSLILWGGLLQQNFCLWVTHLV